MFAASHVAAKTLDEAKLKLLYCITTDPLSPSKKGAIDWINSLPKSEQYGPAELVGPLWLGEACVKNVQVGGAFGAWIAKGETCNKDLSHFIAALSKIGVNLEKDIVSRGTKFAYGLASSAYGYSIFKGRTDLSSGRFHEDSEEFTFACAARVGGPQ